MTTVYEPTHEPAGLTGLEMIQRMVSGQVPVGGIGRMMNMRAGAADTGWVEFTGTPGREHYNPVGTVHGGYAATLLDSCMACAVHTTLPAGVSYTTVDLNITYLRAMTDQTGDVTARGEVIVTGRRIATARGTLTDDRGRLIATGTTTCMVLTLEKAK
jgi:uncharacterized protein (TIGR00369 family)